MTYKNTIKNFSDSIRVATFGCLFMSCLMMINIYLPQILMENQPVCTKQGVVQEIIAISGSYAQIKLQDKSIINQPIKNYDSEKKVFKNQIETNQLICVEYENIIIYKLYLILASYKFR